MYYFEAEQGSISGKCVYSRKIEKNNRYMCRIQDGKTTITCFVQEAEPVVGNWYLVRGEWQEHEKYGRQLKNCICLPYYPTKESMTKYLMSAPAVNRKIAIQITEVLGCPFDEHSLDNRDIIKKKLRSIRGITEEKAEFLVHYLLHSELKRKLYQILGELGISHPSISALYRIYGDDTIVFLKRDPYQTGLDGGLDFEDCETVAEHYGFGPYNQKRIDAVICVCLSNAAQEGHAYLQLPVLVERMQSYFQESQTFFTKMPERLLTWGIYKSKKLVMEGQDIYLRELRQAESDIPKRIRQLFNTKKPIPIQQSTIEQVQKELDITYDQHQTKAFALFSEGVGVITGRPGCGKTTVIKGLLAAYQQSRPDAIIKLCAPTGCAAHKMHMETAFEAETIHRLLGITADEEIPRYPSKVEADLLIIDESSMIRLELAAALLNAVRDGTTVLFLGDHNQLPAIGPGNFLRDLVFCGRIPVVYLGTIHRQGGDSLISMNADRILAGETDLQTGDDFQILDIGEKEWGKVISESVRRYYNPKVPYSMQLMSPLRDKGQGSCHALNQMIQGILHTGKDTRRLGRFYVQDKVMTIHNNYDQGYYNGDIGLVQDINTTEEHLTLAMDSSTFLIEREHLSEIALAFCLTIHKLQGGECQVALIVLPKEAKRMLNRNLLYTAVTRARKKVILIASEEMLDHAIKTLPEERNTKLLLRLQRI